MCLLDARLYRYLFCIPTSGCLLIKSSSPLDRVRPHARQSARPPVRPPGRPSGCLGRPPSDRRLPAARCPSTVHTLPVRSSAPPVVRCSPSRPPVANATVYITFRLLSTSPPSLCRRSPAAGPAAAAYRCAAAPLSSRSGPGAGRPPIGALPRPPSSRSGPGAGRPPISAPPRPRAVQRARRSVRLSARSAPPSSRSAAGRLSVICSANFISQALAFNRFTSRADRAEPTEPSRAEPNRAELNSEKPGVTERLCLNVCVF